MPYNATPDGLRRHRSVHLVGHQRLAARRADHQLDHGRHHRHPDHRGPATFTVTATDGDGQPANQGVTCVIAADPSIVTASLPDGEVNVPYSQTPSAHRRHRALHLVGHHRVAARRADPRRLHGRHHRYPDRVGSGHLHGDADRWRRPVGEPDPEPAHVIADPAIVTASLPAGEVGAAYSQNVTAAGGYGSLHLVDHGRVAARRADHQPHHRGHLRHPERVGPGHLHGDGHRHRGSVGQRSPDPAHQRRSRHRRRHHCPPASSRRPIARPSPAPAAPAPTPGRSRPGRCPRAGHRPHHGNDHRHPERVGPGHLHGDGDRRRRPVGQPGRDRCSSAPIPPSRRHRCPTARSARPTTRASPAPTVPVPTPGPSPRVAARRVGARPHHGCHHRHPERGGPEPPSR